MKFNIDNQSTDEILKGIKNNHVDFGFISDIKDLDKYNNLEAILVKKEEYVFIVPKNHPLANNEEVYLSDLKNEYFIADLIGLKMISDEGEDLGELTDVLQTGANDVYVISKEGADDILLPAIKDCVKQVDIEGGTMQVHLLDGLRDLNSRREEA